MGRVVAVSLLVALVLPLFAGCAILDRPDRWELEVTVGVLLGEPGAGYPLWDAGDAVEVAARQVDDAGYGLKMRILRDTAGSDPAAAFDRLAKRGAAAIVAAVEPEDAQALAARAAALKRPLLLATPAAGPLAGDVSHTIQVAQDPAAHGRALAKLAAEKGATSPVLFHAQDPFVALAVAGFQAAWTGEAPGHVVHRIGSQSEIMGAAQEVCATQADALVVLSRPDEAGWGTRALADGGCRERVRVLAAPGARGPALVEEAGEDAADRPVAAGVEGIEAARSRGEAFRALFEAETGRVPGVYATEAYDAAIYVVLASFAAKGNEEARPARATIGPAELQAHLLRVASAPGIQHQALANAIEAAQAADELDWPGYAHDDAFTTGRQPEAARFTFWRVGSTGGFTQGADVTP